MEDSSAIKTEVVEEEVGAVEGKEGDEGGVEAGADRKDKRRRRRKRQVFVDICKQMEFYFSDANITKNRLMLEMITAAEFVPLETFLDFNRIKSIGSSVDDLRKALASSEKLIISEDGAGVKRKVAYDPEKLKSDEEIEECTVYVENVPRLVDHAWLEKIFHSFGPIAYISLPKFKTSGQPKGFAFIEFERKESAKGCIEAYQEEGAALPTDMDPGQLMSLMAFNEEQEHYRKGATPGSKSQLAKSPSTGLVSNLENSRKRKLELEDDNEDVDNTETSKRPKESRSVRSTVSFTTPSEIGTDTITNQTSALSNTEAENCDEGHAGETEEKEKSHKKRRKRNKMAKTAEEKLEGDSIHLRVMTKRAWRQLRNRYLNLQRQNMSKLKQQLRDHNLREQYYKNCNQDPRVKCGNIVELRFDSPAESVESFKKQIQVDLCGQSEEEAAISQFVKYVDYEEGGLKAFIRFGEDECFADRIKAFVDDAGKVFKWSKILTVQESLEYKARVQEALKHKKKQHPRKKERGKDRLLRAAAKASQHIRFDGLNDADGIDMCPKSQLIINSDDSGMGLGEPESTTA